MDRGRGQNWQRGDSPGHPEANNGYGACTKNSMYEGGVYVYIGGDLEGGQGGGGGGGGGGGRRELA